MAECMFEPMTAAQFLQFLADLPPTDRYAQGWGLVGWFMTDLTDEARARAAEFVVQTWGVTALPDATEQPSGEFSPRTP